MKKYILLSAMATNSGHLLLPKDEVYAEPSESGNMYYLYDPKARKKIGTSLKAKFEAAIEPIESEKILLGGFQSWIETYSEMFSYILAVQKGGKNSITLLGHNLVTSVVFETQENYGFAQLRDLAVGWTDEFQEKFKDYNWDNGDFYEVAEAFARSKDLDIPFEKARTAVEREAKTEGIINLTEIDQQTEDFEINNDQKNALCDADLIQYRSEFGWHYFKEDYDKIKLILNPQPFQDYESDDR